jgi:hypothetical protein
MDQEKIDCENSGGTWTEVDGTSKCVHPQSSTASSEGSSDEVSEK